MTPTQILTRLLLAGLSGLVSVSCAGYDLNHPSAGASAEVQAARAPAREARLPSLFADRPEWTSWSTWTQEFDRAHPQPQRRLGGLGIGNGRAFALQGLLVPFSTLHNLTGPDYQIGDGVGERFFSDKTLSLRSGGRAVEWDVQRLYRIRRTGVNVVRQETSDLTLWTIDFAPWTADPSPASDALVRLVVVQNRARRARTDLSLEAGTVTGEAWVPPLADEPARAWGAEPDAILVEQIEGDTRAMASGFTDRGAGLRDKGKAITIDVGPVPAGGEFVTAQVFAFSRSGNEKQTLDAVRQLDLFALLDETIASWRRYLAGGATLSTSDPRFDELLESIQVTIRAQTAETGGVTQMSRYSWTWLRDIMGMAKFLPLVGRTAELRGMIDYYARAARAEGTIRNALPVDVPADAGAAEPDWAALPVGSGREAAESVSYLVLHYREYVRATGDWDAARAVYPMLRHALVKQDFRDGCLLPFSDDETFRGALAATLGIWLDTKFQEKYLSANSSFLFVTAAEFMAELAAESGLDADAGEYRQMAADVRACTEKNYWLEPEGFYAPVIDIKTHKPLRRPFEDVDTKPLWTGYLAPGDPKARRNVLRSLENLEVAGGFPYSPISVLYRPLSATLNFRKGIVTGMTYGFWLDNLTRLDHPAAGSIFALYDRFFQSTGVVSEYHVVDDFGRLVYYYGDDGIGTDQTAAYRTWEAGINGAAMLAYLFGLEPDAPNGRVAVSPHLPAGWEFAEISGVTVGDATLAVRVERAGAGLRAIVSSDRPIDLYAQMSVEGGLGAVTVDGVRVDPRTAQDFGRTRAYLAGLPLAAGKTVTIEATPK